LTAENHEQVPDALEPCREVGKRTPASNISVHVAGDVNGSCDPDRVLQVVANLAGTR
jgi:hypothetical protein